MCVCVCIATQCLDSDWLRVHKYTPSGPEELHVSVKFREDIMGQLQPVLHVSWKIKDDGNNKNNIATLGWSVSSVMVKTHCWTDF